MTTKTRLTDTAVKHVRPPATGQAEIWDSAIAGFGVRVTSKGVKSFVLLYRYQGQSRRWTLGRYPALPLAKARAMASDALTVLESGHDPQTAQEARTHRFADTLDSFFTTYCDHQNKASTAAETRRNMTATFREPWGTKSLASIGRADTHHYRWLDGEGPSERRPPCLRPCPKILLVVR